MFFPCIYDLYFSFSFFSKYIHERFLSKIIYSYICSKFHEISFSSFELRVYINKIIYKFLVARMASDSDTRTIGNRDTLIFHVVIDKASIKLIISIQPCELIHRSNDLLFLPTFVSRNFVNSIRDPSFFSLSFSLFPFDISHNFAFIGFKMENETNRREILPLFFSFCSSSCAPVWMCYFVGRTGHKNITLRGFVVIFDSRCILDLIKLQKD